MSKRSGSGRSTGNVRRIREAAEGLAGKVLESRDPAANELAVRSAWGFARDAHEGLITRKPWEFPVCAVIPTCGPPELAALCLAFVAKQTVPVYSLVIDTGSTPAQLERLQSLRSPAVEVHQIAGHGWRHSAEAVGAAMALGQVLCRSNQMLALHSDAFLIAPTAVEELQGAIGTGMAAGYSACRTPAYGFEARPFLSHSTTILPPNQFTPWDRAEYLAQYAAEFGEEWDPEFGLNYGLIGRKSLGQENGEPQEDERRIHLSAATSQLLNHGLDEPRRGALLRAIGKARAMEAPVPPWAWRALYAMAEASPEGGGVKFEPQSWAPVPEGETVTFVAPFYQYDPILLDALQRQTVPNWRLILLHDGPVPEELHRAIARRRDDRTMVRETPERFNDYGHSLRQIGLNMIAKGLVPSDWVVITNGDNYYVPGFVEGMLAAVRGTPYKGALCDMVHNYWAWRNIRSCLTHGEIDCGAVMVAREIAIDAGWRAREVAADWIYIRDVLERIGHQAFAKVDRSFFIHN